MVMLETTQIRHVVYLDHVRTVTEKNTGGHWRVKARRAKDQRYTVFVWLQHLLGRRCPVTLPCTITLTRVAPRSLDPQDNLPSALSHVTDGVSDYLAGRYLTGQDRQPGLTWQYAQRRGKPGEYGVEIVVEEG